MYNKEISIIIPIYNEEKNIGVLIDLITKILNKKLKNFEIIIIDDNSFDNSKQIIQRKIKKNKKIKYILRKRKKKDLSMSVIEGLDNSSYNNVVVMDGDLQHDPIYILSFLKTFKKYNPDFIIGCRNFKRYTPIKGFSYLRYLSSKLIILITNFFLKLNLKDPMSGYFFFKKEIYKLNKRKLYGKGFKILLDLIISHKNNFVKKPNIYEFYINFKPRNYGVSKMSLNVIFIYFLFLFKRFF
jgi:dolichol-phosphate mannosyltransferase